MSTATIDNNITTFKVDNKEFVIIPKKDFLEYRKYYDNDLIEVNEKAEVVLDYLNKSIK
jgi:hypothetical protein